MPCAKAFPGTGEGFFFLTQTNRHKMASQNLTASALTYAQERLESLFAAGLSTPSRYPWVNHMDSARAMLAEHRANTQPIFDSQNRCIGHRVYWLTKGDTTIVHDGTPGDFTGNCTIPSGQGPVSDEKIYTNNFLIASRIEVNDDICGNVFRDGGASPDDQAGTLIAERFQTALWDLRDKLNTRWINFLDTNKTSVNNDSSLPSGVSFGSSLFTVTESTLSMQEPDTLTDLDAIAINNDLTDYFYVAGRKHFYNAVVNSDFRRANDNERDHIRFDRWRMYFDIKNLDSTLSGSNSFIVDPGAFVFWDFVNNERLNNGAGVITMANEVEDNTWEYWIEDPFLTINGRPLRINVTYQKTCNGENTTQMRRTYTHRWELKLHGGIYVAPPSEDNHTGILKFKSA